MVMHNPPHPGEVIWEFCIERLDLSVTKAAEGLDVSLTTLSELIIRCRFFCFPIKFSIQYENFRIVR